MKLIKNGLSILVLILLLPLLVLSLPALLVSWLIVQVVFMLVMGLITSEGSEGTTKTHSLASLQSQGANRRRCRHTGHGCSFIPNTKPKGAQTVDKVDALDQLKLWKVYQDHWCEHKPSITVHYTDDNFLQCAAWLWDNFDDVSGVAFLPLYENDYAQAPYESVSGAEYKEAAKAMPTLDWTAFDAMEEEDTTTGSQEFACVGNQCELP